LAKCVPHENYALQVAANLRCRKPETNLDSQGIFALNSKYAKILLGYEKTSFLPIQLIKLKIQYSAKCFSQRKKIEGLVEYL